MVVGETGADWFFVMTPCCAGLVTEDLFSTEEPLCSSCLSGSAFAAAGRFAELAWCKFCCCCCFLSFDFWYISCGFCFVELLFGVGDLIISISIVFFFNFILYMQKKKKNCNTLYIPCLIATAAYQRLGCLVSQAGVHPLRDQISDPSSVLVLLVSHQHQTAVYHL